MLRGAALRVTRPRVAVLSAVHDHPHADTETIIDVAREHLGRVSGQARPDSSGYQIDETEVIYWGRCAEYGQQARQPRLDRPVSRRNGRREKDRRVRQEGRHPQRQ